MPRNHITTETKGPIQPAAELAPFYAQDQSSHGKTRLGPDVVQAYRYLDAQGLHFVLVNRDKVPIHRRWQLPWERPTLGQVLRHLAGGGLVGHVPAAVGCVVLDLDESDDGGKTFMDRSPALLGHPQPPRSGGLHLYYLSRVQYGNRDWRMGSAAGQLRSRNGFVVIWDPHELGDMLACRAMSPFPPEDDVFPSAVLGARAQPPRDWGQRTPPPRREPAERRRPSQPPLPGIAAPRRSQEPQEAGRPPEWVLREPPGHLRAARSPKGNAPGERNVRLFDAVRYFAYALPRGRGGPAMYAQWGRFILEYAEACNEMFAAPLSHGDVAKTARSVSKFCWANPSFGRPVDLGRWDSDVQRRRSRLGVLARQRRVVDRNRVIRAMHEEGRGIRAIGREMDLSASQVSRVVQAGPLVLHNPITMLGVGGWVGSVKSGQSEGYEIRNGFAADFQYETSHKQPEKEPEPANIAGNTDENRLQSPARVSEAVPAWAMQVARESGLTVAEVLQLARDTLRTGWRIRLSGDGLDRLERRERGPPP